MKVAIVHDWLDTYRGGERVLEALLDLYPDAVVYTLFYTAGQLPPSITRHRIVTPQFVPSFFSRIRKALLPLLPTLVESFDLSGYDLVLSSSSCVAKGVIASPQATHISYVHSPMRYVWDERFRYFKSLPALMQPAMYWPFHLVAGYLRMWDASSSLRVDQFIANSRFVASRIQSYYRRESVVLNPGVEVERFSQNIVPYTRRESYYLVFGAHVFYKRHDFAVSMFSKHPECSLVVAGHGPELENLKSIAGSNVRFVENPTPEEVHELYSKARGLIFPGVEDFGMIPVEAMAAGCPVFAYGCGGILDSVEEGVSGQFFKTYDLNECWSQFQRFKSYTWDSEKMSGLMRRFSITQFKKNLAIEIERAVSQKHARQSLSSNVSDS